MTLSLQRSGILCGHWFVPLLLGVLVRAVEGYPSGAPNSACSSLLPGHGTESTDASPYSLSLGGATTYKEGRSITVTIQGPTFQGLMMQVRDANKVVYGTWTSLPADTRTQTCSNNADTVTHLNTNAKENAAFTWELPEDADVKVDLQFVATVASGKLTWWSNIVSATLSYDAPTTTTTTTTPSTTSSSTLTPTVTVDSASNSSVSTNMTVSPSEDASTSTTPAATSTLADGTTNASPISRMATALVILIPTTIVSSYFCLSF